MSITTKRGDQGDTDLLGARVGKDHALIAVVGSLDELNAHLGAVLADVHDRTTLRILRRVQEQLFVLGAEVASVPSEKKVRAKLPHLQEADLRYVERVAKELEAELPRLTAFILPGGSAGGSKLHLARAVSRRTERELIVAAKAHPDLSRAVPYLNRLSDLLFSLARTVNRLDGAEEVTWKGSS